MRNRVVLPFLLWAGLNAATWAADSKLIESASNPELTRVIIAGVRSREGCLLRVSGVWHHVVFGRRTPKTMVGDWVDALKKSRHGNVQVLRWAFAGRRFRYEKRWMEFPSDSVLHIVITCDGTIGRYFELHPKRHGFSWPGFGRELDAGDRRIRMGLEPLQVMQVTGEGGDGAVMESKHARVVGRDTINGLPCFHLVSRGRRSLGGPEDEWWVCPERGYLVVKAESCVEAGPRPLKGSHSVSWIVESRRVGDVWLPVRTRHARFLETLSGETIGTLASELRIVDVRVNENTEDVATLPGFPLGMEYVSPDGAQHSSGGNIRDYIAKALDAGFAQRLWKEARRLSSDPVLQRVAPTTGK